MKNRTDTTGAKRQARRYAVLNRKARAAGWSSWAAYCTAVINGDVNLKTKSGRIKKQLTRNLDGDQATGAVGAALR